MSIELASVSYGAIKMYAGDDDVTDIADGVHVICTSPELSAHILNAFMDRFADSKFWMTAKPDGTLVMVIPDIRVEAFERVLKAAASDWEEA